MSKDLPKYAITGARGRLSVKQRREIREAIDALPSECVVITGACIGVDAYVARYAIVSGRQVHTIVPSNRSLVDPEYQHWCHSYEGMPPDTDYRQRNARLVSTSTHGLIGFPRADEDKPESQRSGTWQTIRMGRSRRESEYTVTIVILGPEPDE